MEDSILGKYVILGKANLPFFRSAVLINPDVLHAARALSVEMESLQAGLVAAVGALRPTGRLAVITFHSLEDRAVKEFGRNRCREYTYPGTVDVPELREPRVPELKWVARKAIKPGDQELRENVRSRSAQLRVLEKT